jgi:hypothetical protein
MASSVIALHFYFMEQSPYWEFTLTQVFNKVSVSYGIRMCSENFNFNFNKASRSVKHKEFTDQLSDYQLLKKKIVPWSNLELLWRTFTSEEAERDVPLLP